MKKLCLLLLLGLVISPFLANAQEDCFEDVPGSVMYFEQISESMNCALVDIGGGCEGIVSEETIVHLDQSNIDHCSIWCNYSGAPHWTTSAGQEQIFENIMELAPDFAPECSSTGAPMTLIDIIVDLAVIGSTQFVYAELTFACCFIPEDCQADFNITWIPTIGDCHYELINASTPSALNNCGDCENAAGITSVKWSVSTLHGTPPFQYVSPFTSSTDFNFDFDPSGAIPNEGFQICLTIKDCVGCTDRICKTVTNQKLCPGLKEEKEELRVPLVDCESDFQITWIPTIGDCHYELTNASTTSEETDCGDCENPSGITSVSWDVSTLHGTPPFQYTSPYTSSSDYHFAFDPGGAIPNEGFQICLRIEDCDGCMSSICKTVNKIKLCPGFTGGNGKDKTASRSNSPQINVFPNPASEALNVQIRQKDFDAQISSIEIIDLQGRLVKSVTAIQEGLNTIDLSGLNSNIYILNLILDGEYVHSEKIVIE